MKWTKASDNPDPGISRYHVVRWNTGVARVYTDSNKSLELFCNRNDIEMGQLEWLDESSPAGLKDEETFELAFNKWEASVPEVLMKLLSGFAMEHTYPVRGFLRNSFKAFYTLTPSTEELNRELREDGDYWGDQWVRMAELCRSQEQEIEKLKGLIEKQFKENNGWDMKEIDGKCEVFQSQELSEQQWQQFKTDNSL